MIQDTQLSLTNRATRLEVSQEVTNHGTIPYVSHGFLLCNIVTMCVRLTFFRYSTSNMPWPWKPG